MGVKKSEKAAGGALPPRRVAIACQGGGSHTAFTAGVLQSLLLGMKSERHVVHGLSGTSGGALCAALAWTGLLRQDKRHGAELLESFWREMAASLPVDALTNASLVWLQRAREYLALPEVSPYQLPELGKEYLAALLQRHIPFAELGHLVKPDSPRLLVGAVDVLSGVFATFNSHHRRPAQRISVDALLASAAVPELFRAVRIEDGAYWDGLFSQNPPIRGFISGHKTAAEKPDEIWVIQINPGRRHEEPRTVQDIADRRNELAGNLSLNQELFFVRQTNDWLEKGWLSAAHFKPIAIHTVAMDLDLDYPSKLDRSPGFIADLMTEGRRRGKAFLAGLPAV